MHCQLKPGKHIQCSQDTSSVCGSVRVNYDFVIRRNANVGISPKWFDPGFPETCQDNPDLTESPTLL